MSEHLHDIDDLFHRNLEPMGATPGNRVWEQIEHALDKDDNQRIRRKYMRWKRWAVAATLLFSCSLFALYISHKTTTNQKTSDHINKQSDSTITVSHNKQNINTGSNRNEFTVDAPANDQPKTTINHTESNDDPTEPKLADNQKNISESKATPTNTKGVSETTGELDEYAAANNRTVVRKEKEKEKGKGKGNVLDQMELKSRSTITASKNDFARKNPVAGADKTVTDHNTLPSQEIVSAKKEPTTAGKKPQQFIPEEYANFRASNNLNLAMLRNGAHVAAEGYKTANLPMVPNKILPTPAKTNFGWGLTVFYEPQIRSYKIQEGLRRHREDDRNEIKAGENIQTVSAYGMLVDYQFPNHWRVQSGIGFTRQSSIIDAKPLIARRDDMRGGGGNGTGEIKYKFNCAAGTVFLDPKTGSTPMVGDSVMALTSVNHNKYLQIPLRVSYIFNAGKFSVAPTVGMQANILQESTLQTTLVDNAGNKTPATTTVNGLRKMYLVGELGAGLDYQFTKRLSVYVMPRAGFSLSPINKETPVKTYTTEWSAVTGLRFQL